LKTFRLYEIARQESVKLSFTLDGAVLCDEIMHLTAGIKVTDGKAIDPRDGSPLSMVAVSFDRILNNQSRNYCFAMKSLLPASQLGPEILPIEIWCPQVLSSIWKSLNTGGGAGKNGDTFLICLSLCSGFTIT